MPSLSETLQSALEGGGFVMPPLCAVTVVLWYALGARLQTLGRGVLRDAGARVKRAPRGPEPAVPDRLAGVIEANAHGRSAASADSLPGSRRAADCGKINAEEGSRLSRGFLCSGRSRC